MKYRQFGVTTVLLVIVLSVWFAVSIVVAWSAPVITSTTKQDGYCDVLRGQLSEAEFSKMMNYKAILDQYISLTRPEGWTSQDMGNYRRVMTSIVFRMLTVPIERLKEAIASDCDIQ